MPTLYIQVDQYYDDAIKYLERTKENDEIAFNKKVDEKGNGKSDDGKIDKKRKG